MDDAGQKTSCPTTPVLSLRDLRKVFPAKDGAQFVAVDKVSLDVMPSQTAALVGGSGSGKSTIAQMVTGLLEPTEGEILVNGCEVARAHGKARRELARNVQMVFQNPVQSFDPRRTLGYGIAESMRNFGASKVEARERACELLGRCGLDARFFDRYPREVSGGQCQRAAIARALALNPPLIVLDEATSALDVTAQARIIELLEGVRAEYGTGFLFICHDLALVRGFSDWLVVLHHGRIAEEGPTESVIANPRDPYTRELLASSL